MHLRSTSLSDFLSARSLSPPGVEPGHDTSDQAFEIIRKIANIVRIRDSPDLTVDEIVDSLIQQPDGNVPTLSSPAQAQQSLRRAVFACIGILTCLYLPKNDTTSNVLAIDVPRTGRVPVTAISIEQASRRIQGMLKNFGELFPDYTLPSRNESTLYSSRLNFFSLNRLCNVQIKWIDVLSAHLIFDSTTKTLLLFRLPSFCLLHSRRTERVSAIHCILKAFNSATIPGNSTEAITQAYLNEVILSYRLLFGQDRRSRNIFMSKEAARAGKNGIQDPFLLKLCGKKQVNLASIDVACMLTTRGFYGVKENFPLLSSRLLQLQEFNMLQDSSTLQEFWADRRNPFNFYTFWAVIVFGSISILLSVVQCGLSTAQLVVSMKQPAD